MFSEEDEMSSQRNQSFVGLVCAIIFLAAALVVAPGTTFAQTWTSAGLSGDVIRTLAVDPQNPLELYAADFPSINSHLFRSPDGGTTWNPLTTTWLPNANFVSAVATDPATSPHTIYAGYYGVRKSTDSGSTWVNTTAAVIDPTSQNVGAIAVDTSTSPSTIYAGTTYSGTNSGRIFWSSDAGATWTLGTGITGTPDSCTAIVVDSEHPGTVYASFRGGGLGEVGGVYKSIDHGVSWTAMTMPASNLAITGLVFDAQNDLYASANDSNHVYKLPDGSSNWVAAGFTTSAWGGWGIAAHPTHPGEVYVGGILYSGPTGEIRRTTDGGATWTDVSSGLSTTAVNAMLTTPTSIFAGTDNGLYVLDFGLPAVSGISPTSGLLPGGDTIIITGTGFTGATAVDFGGTAATSFTVDSDTQITAVNPAHAAGPVDVTVTTEAGQSATTPWGVFTYISPTHTVTASVGVNGSLDGSTPSPVTVNDGETTSFTFNADTNYHVASISGCGGTEYSTPDNAVSSYTYTTGAITADCTVTAVFSINQADLAVSKTQSTTTVTAGGGAGNLTYVVTVTNNGPNDATDVTLSEALTLPAGASVDSTTASVGSVAGTSPNYTWNLGSLANGASATLTVVITAGASTPPGTDIISDTAAVTHADQPDPDSENDSATKSTSVIAPTSVTATKTLSGDVAPGGTVTYTVVLANAGPADAMDDQSTDEFTDVLPAELTLVSASATSGTAVADTGTNTVSWNGAIPAGSSVTLTITATVGDLGEGVLVSNQGEARYDADGDGMHEATALTDDPGTASPDDATVFAVAKKPGIPAVSPAGLAVLIGLLALAGTVVIRRRLI